MGFQAALFDELTPIFPDTDPSAGLSEYGVAGCNGTVAGVHILLAGLVPGLPVTVAVQGPHRCFKLFELRTVPVEVNSGARLRTEYLRDDVNAHVIRRAPFTVYEALDPFYNIFTPPFARAAVAFKTPVEYCRQPRESLWAITVCQGGACRTLTLRVAEFPAAVPKAGEGTFRYVNWLDYDRLARDFCCDKWSGRYFQIFEQYLRAAVFSRQNILAIPVAEMFNRPKGGRPALNGERLDEIIRTARRAGISLFQGGAFLSRMPYGDDDAVCAAMDHEAVLHPEEIAQAYRLQAFEVFDNGTEARVGLTGEPLPGARGEETLRAMAEQLYAYIEKNGLAGHWFQCCLDEPNRALAPVYRRASAILRAAMPGVPIVEPTLEFEGLEGTLDIWCPSLDHYEQHLDFYTGRAALGERIWVYTCLTPAGNYCNRLLDMERLRAVWLGWAPMVYPHIEGYLHWGLNSGIAADPFRRQSGNFSENVLEFHPKHAMFLPAGDCAIFYPGYEGPLISTRSEAHRMGLEDLHLLEQLEEKAPGSALPLVRTMFRKFDDYEKDVSAYRAARLRLLREVCRADGGQGSAAP